jgi:hypothetical protein
MINNFQIIKIKKKNYFIYDKCLNENFNNEGINKNLLYLNELIKFNKSKSRISLSKIR